MEEVEAGSDSGEGVETLFQFDAARCSVDCHQVLGAGLGNLYVEDVPLGHVDFPALLLNGGDTGAEVDRGLAVVDVIVGELILLVAVADVVVLQTDGTRHGVVG